MKFQLILGCAICLALTAISRGADLSIGHEDAPGAVKLVLGSSVADVYVDSKDAKVVNLSAGLLSEDIERVTGKKPNVINDASKLGNTAIIIGSIGQSAQGSLSPRPA